MVRLFHTAPTQRPSATVYATSISARPPEPMSERRQSKMVAAVSRTRSENRPTLGFAASDEILDSYARAPEPVVAAERIVAGALLYEPVLLALRRMAHEALSARR